MTVPESSSFDISDVRALVGGRRIVDVVDCNSNRSLEMSMRDYEQYFKEKDRTHLYDLVSLEFSKSKLDYVIQRPAVIDCLDWIDLVWPQHLKRLPAGNDKPLYPKVQKYCFMSVTGCYTDFHIDFGGSSSWYHVFKGEKVFWLIPPTNENLELYEHCIKADNLRDVFFGDIVSKCQRFTLEQGNSLLIPSGWIYAVYTSKDSIIFGGNFLCSFNIPMQILVHEMEEKLGVPDDFRFPYFFQIHWYALERYVHILSGKSHLSESLQSRYSLKPKVKPSVEVQSDENQIDHVHLTPFEYKGLKRLIDMLKNYPKASRNIPEDMQEVAELLRAGNALLSKHSADDHAMAITGKPKAFWPVPLQSNSMKKIKPKPKIIKQVLVPKKGASSRVRRVRCKQCEACLRDDCKECVFCRDMRKHGGPGTMKQTCIKRRCLNPILPSTASVSVVQSVQIVESSSSQPVEPQAKKEKRPIESNEQFVPAKVPKLEPEEYFEDDYLEDVEYSFSRPIQPVVSRTSWKTLLKYPIRPAPPPEPQTSSVTQVDDVWTNVFKYLPKEDLCNCMLVCKNFLRKGGSPKLWRRINLTARRLKPSLLQFLVRRSPVELNLSHTNASYKQLLWLLERLPSLRKLLLVGCSWSAAAALASASCPPLKTIDLSWSSGFSDPHIRHLFSVPKDAKPGQEITQTRLRFCRELYLAGTEITDKALKLISQRLTLLKTIDLSFCNVTNDGVGYLTCSSSSKTKLVSTIIAQYCVNLNDNIFMQLGKLSEITEIDLRNCRKISDAACFDFVRVCKAPVELSEPFHIVALVR